MLRSISHLLISPFSTLSPLHQLFARRIDRIVSTLHQQLRPSFLKVRDISTKTIDDDQMIRVQVESQLFRDIPKVDQHRMVIACFGEEIEEIHAFLIKTRVPMMDNVVIIRPEEQILEQMLNQQGTIPLERIRDVVEEVTKEEEGEEGKIDKELEDQMKQEYQDEKKDNKKSSK